MADGFAGIMGQSIAGCLFILAFVAAVAVIAHSFGKARAWLTK